MLKTGLSSYSMLHALSDGRMDIFHVMDYIVERGGLHIEIVPAGNFTLTGNNAFIDAVRKYAQEKNLALSSYTIGANFVLDSPEAVRDETERVKREVETAARLGVTRMRHDAGWLPREKSTYSAYERYLPVVAGAAGEIADYAQKYGIVTSVENHGYLFQGSERVERLVNLVGRTNFRTTLDVGNFICADEDPVIAVMNNLPIASMIHFKDFYLRNSPVSCEDFAPTRHGRFFKGSVTGEGDVNLPAIAKLIRESSYDGFISVEYEGSEDCVTGAGRSMKNVIKLFA